MILNDLKYFSFWEVLYIRLYIFLKKIFDLLPQHIIHERNILIFKLLKNYSVDYLIKEKEYLVQADKMKYILRKNSSDILVFNQIIIENEYAPLIQYFHDNKIIPSYIIDCGANIGLSTLYFKSYFPSAKLIAIEPYKPNFNQLQKNCNINQITNIYLLNAGVWGTNTLLSINQNFRDKKEWSIQLNTRGDNTDTIEAHTIQYYMQQFEFSHIDILKMDIEGGEVSVFLHDDDVSNWLKKTNIIAIEIHDEYNCREQIENILKNNFELIHYQELTICFNKKWNY